MYTYLSTGIIKEKTFHYDYHFIIKAIQIIDFKFIKELSTYNL